MLGGMLAAFSACNDSGFTASKEALGQKNGGGGCTVGTSSSKIRVIFMIDDSGSTKTTDPSKAIRVSTLRKFIADYGSNGNLSYNIGYFSGTTGRMYDVVSNSYTVGTSANPLANARQLSSALNTCEALMADGDTPEKVAGDTMKATVTNDENAGNKQDYSVVFMSDGQPTDISGATNLNSLVTSLKTAAGANGSRLTVSTVYFGPANDSGSVNNLKGMATTGGGQFVDTNANGSLVINDVLVVPGNCI